MFSLFSSVSDVGSVGSVSSVDYKNKIQNINNEIKNNPIDSLDDNTQSQVIKMAVVQKYIDTAKKDIDLSSFNFNDMVARFLSSLKSDITVKNYQSAIELFLTWCKEKNINPLYMSYNIADLYISYVKSVYRANNSILLKITAIRALYSYIERITDNQVINGFRGAKLPKKENTKKDKFYNSIITKNNINTIKIDLYTIIDNVSNNNLKTACILMIGNGLRVGAFNSSLIIEKTKFKTVSKNKTITGKLTKNTLADISKYKIDLSKTDYSNKKNNVYNVAIRKLSARLLKEGKITRLYSAHDFRHYFAINEYIKNHDMYKLQKMLNHSSISITENYLKGLHLV